MERKKENQRSLRNSKCCLNTGINILYCTCSSASPDAQRNAPNNGKEIKFLIHVDILPYYTFKNKMIF